MPLGRQPGQALAGLPGNLDARIVLSHDQHSTTSRANARDFSGHIPAIPPAAAYLTVADLLTSRRASPSLRIVKTVGASPVWSRSVARCCRSFVRRAADRCGFVGQIAVLAQLQSGMFCACVTSLRGSVDCRARPTLRRQENLPRCPARRGRTAPRSGSTRSGQAGSGTSRWWRDHQEPPRGPRQQVAIPEVPVLGDNDPVLIVG